MRIAFLRPVIFATALLLHCGTAHAEGLDDKKVVLGGDLQFVVPIGDMSNVAGPQIGPLVRIGGRFTPALEVTARVGYLFGIHKSTSRPSGINGVSITSSASVTTIPIWLGVRYYFMNAPAGLYGATELAFNLMSESSSVSVGDVSSSSSGNLARVGFNVGVGYVVSPEVPIDIRAQFSYFNLLPADNGENGLFGLGLSAGYSLFF